MKHIEEIRSNFRNKDIYLSDHAQTKAVERNISYYEIIEAGAESIIIEDYPYDKYSPSCLLFGYTQRKRPLHLHVSRKDSNIIKIITVYEPNEEEWFNFMERKK